MNGDRGPGTGDRGGGGGGGGGGDWAALERPVPEVVTVGGVELRRGSRVRLRPRDGGDVFDLALAGRVGIVEGIDQELEGALHLSVTLEDDPGRDLGDLRYPAHRFFFRPSEVEPLDAAPPDATPPASAATAAVAAPAAPRVLVAGIGNVFLGDDGFGVAVARRLLADGALPAGVRVTDFGIRGLDLAYALQDDYDAAILVDAAPRGAEPGTLSVIEPAVGEGAPALDAHGMDPVQVLRLARALGRVPPRTLVVACEPASILGGETAYADVLVELSAPVAAAVPGAARLVRDLVAELGVAASHPSTTTMHHPPTRRAPP